MPCNWRTARCMRRRGGAGTDGPFWTLFICARTACFRRASCSNTQARRHVNLQRSMNALSVRGLVKTYKNGVQALRGVDLDVEQGDFFSLLGPNGAGKTTLIAVVTSLVRKSVGAVSVFGYDIDRQLEAAKACIGIVPQE